MIAKTNTQYYQDIADSIRYSKDDNQYESDLIQEKNKIKQMNEDIAAVYNECEIKGAVIPQIKNTTNLIDTVASLQTDLRAFVNNIINAELNEG